MRQIVLTSLVVLAGLGGAASAADTVTLKPDDIIAARQAGYDLQGGVSDAMKAGVAAGSAVKPFASGANAIAAWSKVIVSMFPAGTESGHDTKAKPEIWSDAAGFQKAAANLTVAAEKLATLADAEDKAGFAAQYAEMGKACGACHRQYKNR